MVRVKHSGYVVSGDGCTSSLGVMSTIMLGLTGWLRKEDNGILTSPTREANSFPEHQGETGAHYSDSAIFAQGFWYFWLGLLGSFRSRLGLW